MSATDRPDNLCAPTRSTVEPSSHLHVAGAHDAAPRLAYGPGDLLIIDTGSSGGVQQGQEYFVRRIPMRFGGHRPSAKNPATVHTSGSVRILTVDTTFSTATILHACDAMLPEDYLEPLTRPAVPIDHVAGEVRYDDLATVLAGDEDRTLAGPNGFMVIDRGSSRGVAPGDPVVILRVTKAGMPLVEIGEGAVLATEPEASTIRIAKAKDAIRSGDRVAFVK